MTNTETSSKKVETLETLRTQLQNADKLAGTPFSELFHEARTCDQIYTGVHCEYTIDSDTGTISQISLTKLRQGEHVLDHPDAADFSLSLPRKPFMTAERAKEIIDNTLFMELDRARQHTL